MTLTFYGRRIAIGDKTNKPIDLHVFSLRCDTGHEPVLIVRHQHKTFVLDPATLNRAAITLPDGVETSTIVDLIQEEDRHHPFRVTKGSTLGKRFRALLAKLNIKEEN